MRSFSAAVSIKATRDQVWPVLTDLSAYPEWNPGVEKLDGAIEPGAKLTVHPKNEAHPKFSIVVEQIEAPKKMVWRDRKPLGALVRTRTFLLRTVREGQVEFEMREVYSGWAAYWLRKTLPDLQSTFEHFAVALKRRVETGAAKESGAELVLER